MGPGRGAWAGWWAWVYLVTASTTLLQGEASALSPFPGVFRLQFEAEDPGGFSKGRNHLSPQRWFMEVAPGLGLPWAGASFTHFFVSSSVHYNVGTQAAPI